MWVDTDNLNAESWMAFLVDSVSFWLVLYFERYYLRISLDMLVNFCLLSSGILQICNVLSAFLWPRFCFVLFLIAALGSFIFCKLFSEAGCMFSAEFQGKSLEEWLFPMSRFLLALSIKRTQSSATGFNCISHSQAQLLIPILDTTHHREETLSQSFCLTLLQLQNSDQARVGNFTCVFVFKF